MTVCIAAICEGGNAIILAADRFRWHGDAAMETELEDPKFYFLSDKLALMGSGTSTTIEEVLRKFSALPADPGLTAVEASERFQDACQAVREKQVEIMYSKRLLGLTFAEFKALVPSASPGSIAWDLYNKSLNHSFGSTFIVAGVDQDGAHIHAVDDTANVSGTDSGCLAIGSGGTLASVAMARRAHRKSAPLSEALYNVFEAKKTAEMAKGVGATTDISVIRKGLPRLDISMETMGVLDEAYEKLKPTTITTKIAARISDAIAAQSEGSTGV